MTNVRSNKKHLKIVNRFRFISFTIFTVIVLTFAIGAACGLCSTQALENEQYISVKVQYGDTLWNLAKLYGDSSKDVREIIYDICSVNGIRADQLQAGQEILIPCN